MSRYLDERNIKLISEAAGKSDSSCRERDPDAFCILNVNFAFEQFPKQNLKKEIDLIRGLHEHTGPGYTHSKAANKILPK